MKQQNPETVVGLAAEHNIHFLPPPPGRRACTVASWGTPASRQIGLSAGSSCLKG